MNKRLFVQHWSVRAAMICMVVEEGFLLSIGWIPVLSSPWLAVFLLILPLPTLVGLGLGDNIIQSHAEFRVLLPASHVCRCSKICSHNSLADYSVDWRELSYQSQQCQGLYQICVMTTRCGLSNICLRMCRMGQMHYTVWLESYIWMWQRNVLVTFHFKIIVFKKAL